MDDDLGVPPLMENFIYALCIFYEYVLLEYLLCVVNWLLLVCCIDTHVATIKKHQWYNFDHPIHYGNVRRNTSNQNDMAGTITGLNGMIIQQVGCYQRNYIKPIASTTRTHIVDECLVNVVSITIRCSTRSMLSHVAIKSTILCDRFRSTVQEHPHCLGHPDSKGLLLMAARFQVSIDNPPAAVRSC